MYITSLLNSIIGSNVDPLSAVMVIGLLTNILTLVMQKCHTKCHVAFKLIFLNNIKL